MIQFSLLRYLLSGDISNAEATFRIHPFKGDKEQVQKLIDKGLVAVSQNDYEEAFVQFQKAHELEKENTLVIFKMIQASYLHNFPYRFSTTWLCAISILEKCTRQ